MDQPDISILGANQSLRSDMVNNDLENQKIQAGNLANAQGGNVYATQVLSAATATGNQDIYNAAKSHLADGGFDMSSWAPDVQTAQTQAQAARLAQSPLGSLLNAQTKMSANDIAAVSTYGSMDRAVAAGYKPEGIQGLGGFAGQTSGLPAATTPAATATQPGGATSGFAALPVTKSGATTTLPQSGSGALPPASGAPATVPPALPGAAAAPQSNMVIDGNGSTPTKFNPPAYVPGESQQVSQQKTNDAFEQWKSNPAVLQASKEAEAAGTAAGALPVKAATASSLSDRIMQGLDTLDTINESGKLPYSGMLDADTKAYLSNKFGTLPGGDNQEAARAYQNFSDINKQQVVVSLQDMLAAAPTGSRMSQALIGLINQANGVNANASQASIRDQIGILRNEVKNIGLSEENTNAKINGGTTQSYNPIPANTAAPYTQGMVKQGTDGSYVFMGGDPKQQTSWKKVAQ